MTLHIADHLDIEALQLTPEIAVDNALNQQTNPLGKACTNLCHIHRNHKAIHIPKGVTIYDPQTGYYSLDDHSSDSEEDSDHLN